jgi:hypothetical protein
LRIAALLTTAVRKRSALTACVLAMIVMSTRSLTGPDEAVDGEWRQRCDDIRCACHGGAHYDIDGEAAQAGCIGIVMIGCGRLPAAYSRCCACSCAGR